MDVKLHANATTTPRTRAYIQSSSASVAELAGELGVSQTTIRRWKGRDTVKDGSHVAHKLAISLSPVEEELVLQLRSSLGLSLDDIVEVMRRCLDASLSRSAIYRCLRRNGVSRLPGPEKPAIGRFEETPIGFVHIDLKHLTRLEGRPSYVFVAIERATRFVSVEIIEKRDAATVSGCLERFLAAFPCPVHTILTDNGAEFTDRFGGAYWHPQGKAPSGRHPFDTVCAAHGIEHRLTRPFHPQTNGMVERFNRRIAQAIRNRPGIPANAGKNKFKSHDERNAFLHAFVQAYNQTRLKALNYKAPAETLNNQTEHYTFAGMTRGWEPTLEPQPPHHRRGEPPQRRLPFGIIPEPGDPPAQHRRSQHQAHAEGPQRQGQAHHREP